MTAHSDTPRSLTLLGSTGSIGTQTLDVVARNPGQFTIAGLAASGTNPQELAAQVRQFDVARVAISEPRNAQAVRAAFDQHGVGEVDLLIGQDATAQLAGSGSDIVLNAVAGSIGLGATLSALGAGSTLALANKESLVAGGNLVLNAVRRPGQLVPVDSEHSAMAQAMRAGRTDEVARLILTASGGPFRGWRAEQLRDVTVAQALAHPTWSMGPVVTINSATLMNKALELIEAQVLFGVPADRIAVVVHPQSLVHSAVEFIDGSTIAQVSPPDMRLPIAVALDWPNRLPHVIPAYPWDTAADWHFEPLDDATFPAIKIARAAVSASAWHTAALNAANEVAVDKFRRGNLSFPRISQIVEAVVEATSSTGVTGAGPATFDDVIEIEQWARARAAELSEE